MINPYLPLLEPAPGPGRIRLRDPVPADAELLCAWRQEEAVKAHQPFSPLTVEQIRQDIERTRSNELPNFTRERFQWIIERREDRTALGWVTVSIRSWEHQIAEIGYSLSPTYHRQGYGSEAVAFMLNLLFYEANMVRIEAKCSVENLPSYALLERLGFRREGVLRGYFNINGRRVDHYLYSLLRTEFTHALRERPAASR